MGPYVGLNTNTNASAAAAGGAIDGRKYSVRYVREPGRGSVSNHAVKIANVIRSGTPTMMIQIVLRNANQKNGSFVNMNV